MADYQTIKQFNDTHGDMPDGAFFALAEEMGITMDDFAEAADRLNADYEAERSGSSTSAVANTTAKSEQAPERNQ